ncbi:orotidine 5'-phosphate decarboxylase / HUMPS family protein [Cellulomonas xiejunii]|uniref:Orotidine 5'-phosphate decarboxylase n=1 Tax=Cellulomonas xiejunii TaxID=2968083 RepID=A0ABY5KSE6_9CELL|nr:orotidine 5'-phosphate decarboxylase / HUMPS family protein [Cellulomonas xiejunii]MCC2321450.1 orotidine 5'-phosphate decarboxylase [Cellulomonas xiejunii]MCC2323398.1 orotidine 5'-phosphate decarboxylase [Cellulomonas xiejunii]UUI72025.1 orotidine 5'-phosphate decarboxylase [Cellulomonas xiejunii]
MQLQVALDRIPLDRAVALAAAVAPWVDGIEVGTSLVKRYGVEAVRAVVAAVADVGGESVGPHEGAGAGRTWVHADLKTVDDAATEVGLALDAGARSVSVLGLASDATLDTAVRTAAARGGEVVVDLMLTSDARRAALAARLDPAVRLGAHVGKDDQAAGASVLDMLGTWAAGRALAVAGGLGVGDVPALRDVPGLRLVVGSAVTGAADPVAVVRALDTARVGVPVG